MERLTIVLLGHTGVGKSASGNTILGRQAFESRRSFRSVTTMVSKQLGHVEQWDVCVVDTPGIRGNEDTIRSLCMELLDTTSPVLFLLVLKIDRFTEEQQSGLSATLDAIGERGRPWTFLLFTGQDTLENMTLEEYITEDPKSPLPHQVRKFHSRYHAFNNNHRGPEQVQELLSKYKQCCNIPSGEAGEDNIPSGEAGEDNIPSGEAGEDNIPSGEAGEDNIPSGEAGEDNIPSGEAGEDNIPPGETASPNPSPPCKGDLRLVLLGLPGAGKSSSGNTIFGKDVFEADGGFDSVTSKTQAQTAEVDGWSVTVVDTPGVSTQSLSPKKLFCEIIGSIQQATPGRHAFIIVVRIGRVHAADAKVFDLLPKMFDQDAPRFSMVLFTHADRLGTKCIEHLIERNRAINLLVSKCGGRYCVFNNLQQSNNTQVHTLLRKVRDLFKANGTHYSPEMFSNVHFLPVEISIKWHNLRDWFLEIIEKITQMSGSSKDVEYLAINVIA